MAGSAAPWVVLVVLLLAVLGVLALWSPGRSVNTVGGSAAVDPSVGAMQAVAEELGEIGDLFGKAIENSRDAQPLIDRVDVVLAEHPELAEAHTLRAQLLMAAGRLDESLDAFDASLKIDARQPEVLMLAGTVAGKSGRYEDARHHFEQALSIDPGNGRYAISLASAQIKLGQDDEAVQTLLAAIRRDSELHGAYMTLSDIYGKQNKLGIALSQIDRAIEKLPKDKPVLRVTYTLRRAKLLRRNNQPGESLVTLTSLPDGAPYQPNVMRDIAISWTMLGKPAMAAKHYEQALTLDPSNDLAAAQAARFRIKAGDIDTARKHVETLRRINPRAEALVELDRLIRVAAESR
jgi:tetratricopeptide (TPR) repeat protein